MSEAETDTVVGPSSELDDTVAGESKANRGNELRRGAALGRYVVLEHLGTGGMGIVVAAYDPELDRKVAIKILRNSEGPRDNGRTLRLQREARSLARLVHSNVVSVYDVGSFQGSVFVAMEHVEGQTLEALMTQWHADPPAWKTIVSTFLQAGRGLAAAHRAGIVHRDFKPANVMVASDGRVLVLDFGLAYESDGVSTSDEAPRRASSDSGLRLTQTGNMLGTPAYMSPEQMELQAVGPASDQFSFCVALFQALYGQRPFSGDSLPTLIDSVLNGKIELPSSTRPVPDRIHEALVRGLRRDPADRFASMDDLLDVLGDAPQPSRNTWWWVGGLSALGALGLGLLWSKSASTPCDGVDKAARAIWNEHVAAEVAGQFETVAGRFGRDAAARVTTKLDRYAQRWAAGRRDACEVTRVRKEAKEVVLLSRVLCYERSLAALDGWVTIARTADDGVVMGASTALDRLPDLAQCESNRVELRRAEVLSDPEARAEVQRIEANLERAIAAGEAGQFDGMDLTLLDAVSAAEAIGAKDLEARAQRQHAMFLLNTGKSSEQVLAVARDSVLRAESSGDDLELIASLRALAFIAVRHSLLDECRAALDRLAAVVDRNARPATAVRSMLVLRGMLAQRERNNERVITAMEGAIEHTKQHDLPFVLDDFEALIALATAYVRAGRYDDAEELTREALRLATSELGDEHPNVALIEIAFARTEAGRGNKESALAAYQRAAKIIDARYPEGNQSRAAIHNEIGRSLRALDRTKEALEEYSVGLESMKALVGKDHLDVASFHTNIGLAHASLGAYDLALEHLREALRIDELNLGSGSDATYYAAMNLAGTLRDAGQLDNAERLYKKAHTWRIEHVGPNDALRSEALKGLGEIAHDRGSLEQADESMTQALQLLTPAVKSFVRAEIKFAAAKLRWQLERHDEARALARAAIDDWESGPGQRGLSEARAWLSNHSASANATSSQ